MDAADLLSQMSRGPPQVGCSAAINCSLQQVQGGMKSKLVVLFEP
jgi:hypothetical protein